MFLTLSHTKLDVYTLASDLVLESYKLTKLLPIEERFNIIQQIKRSALSVKLNIAEGSSRKSVLERRRFYEIARSSIVELDTAFEVCIGLNYLMKTRSQKFRI